MSEIKHHPIFDVFERWAGPVDDRFDANFLGVLTRTEFCSIEGNFASGPPSERARLLPRFDEEYFEWIDVLEAAAAANGRFVMFELGAGWGRWLMSGAAAARQRRLDLALVGVEAEPTHFRWMKQHLRDNGVRRSERRLEQAAVAAVPGWVNFHTGDPNAWYGQAIDPNAPRAERPSLAHRLVPQRRRSDRAIVPVRAITLRQLLERYQTVDLIDLDIQGAEADVLEAAQRELDGKVKRIHVGTHSADNEQRLRELFGRLCWSCRNDYAFASEADTPYGRITFQDGVQRWLNPRFTRG
jgi:FkbM family methyltransferase